MAEDTNQVISDGEGGKGSKGPDLGAFNALVSQILGRVDGINANAGQITEAANLAVAAINGAKETAKGEIEGKKIAAIRAVEAAKPKSSWLDELDRPPGWKPGDPIWTE